MSGPPGARLLRIAHVDTERTWRGGEQQLLSLVRCLVERGHHNLIVGRRGSALEKRAPGPYLPINPLGEWDPLAALVLARALRREKIDVVHAHTGHGVSLAVLAALGSGVPVVAARRVDFPLRKNIFTRWKYGRVDAVVAVSRAVRRIVAEGGVPERKVRVVPDGIELERYQGVTPLSKQELGVPEDAFLVGQVAALVPHKDQSNFLKALALLIKEVPRTRAVVLGEGELRGSLVEEARALGLEGVVSFPGFKTDVLRHIAAFDAFCLSSQEEGLGSSILDAMALGVPVVATDAGGIPDVVEDRVTGILVPRRNPAALARGLAEAAADGALRERLARAARERCRLFDQRRLAAEVEALYYSLLEKRPA